MVVAILLVGACHPEETEDAGCVANVDCPGTSACVNEMCITNPAQCQQIGAFADIIEIEPLHADTVNEIHVTVDHDGAVHYCYSGLAGSVRVSYYGRQIAWDTVVESKLRTAEVNYVQCGGLAVTRTGIPYILSRNPAAVLFPLEGDNWQALELSGLTGVEASGALRGPYTSISLTPDGQDGIYLGLSLGFDLVFQPLYLAHANRTGLKVLLNGWSEDGNHTAFGHAPQFFIHQGAQLVVGKWLDFEIAVVQADLVDDSRISGAFSRAKANPDGSASLLYVDRNRELRLSRLIAGQVQLPVTLGTIGPIESEKGQIPWELVTDDGDTAHVLYEDKAQGKGLLLYQTVDTAGQVSAAQFVAGDVSGEDDLPGMQKFALGTDICQRPVIAAVLSRAGESTDEQSGLRMPVIAVVEGR